jgi:hypothetical protein
MSTTALTPVTEDDVREFRRTLTGWTLDRYTAVRDEQREKGAAPRELVTLNHDTTLADALSALSANGILSAPIIDRYTGDYIGACARGACGARTAWRGGQRR